MLLHINSKRWGISLVVHWLRPCASDADSLGSIPSQGTRSHRLQLRVLRLQLTTPAC